MPTLGSTAVSAAILLVVALLVVPGPAATGRGATVSGDPTYALSVAATPDYGYQPATFEQIPTATNVSVTFTDDDVLQHSFTISTRQGFVIPNSYTTTQLDQFFVAYPAMFSLMVNPGNPPSVGHFESPPSPGWYEFICNVSGHFQLGMYGFIAFGENLPSNLTHGSPVGLGGARISAAEAASIGALLLVVVVAVVLWRRGKAPPRPVSTPSSRTRGSEANESPSAGSVARVRP